MQPQAKALAALVAAVAIAGCGSSKQSTFNNSLHPTPGSSAGTNGPVQTNPGTTTTTPSQTPPRPASGGCSGGDCASSPSQAGEIVASHGFTGDTSSYDPSTPLNVVLATRTGSADGTQQQAFFFWHGRYIGTDTSDTSAGIKLASQNGDTVALTYRLYNPSDPQCCATAGETTVRYQYQGSRLVPLDPIPPSSYGAASSRR